MAELDDRDYYQARRERFLQSFDQEVTLWRPHLADTLGDPAAAGILAWARDHFTRLIPRLPYIGGDANQLTPVLIEAARCLALFQAMQSYGKSPAETGYVLYQAELERPAERPPLGGSLASEELMESRRQRAARSQERRYAWDFVYTFVPGDGHDFDYGYDFLHCAVQKFYKAQRGEVFLPYFCCLDFTKCARQGIRLLRTCTLADGGEACNFRFSTGATPEAGWPPSCLSLAIPSPS